LSPERFRKIDAPSSFSPVSSKPQAGERLLGSNVQCGYFAQYRSQMLNAKQSVLDEALDHG
jgi:hypothetical protein